MDFIASAPIKRTWIEAEIVRADGTRIPLGVIDDSRKRWRFGLGRLGAIRRIRAANKQIA